MQAYTRNTIENFRSNLHIQAGVNIKGNALSEEKSSSKHYFQILIFNDKESPGKLLYGTKEDLESMYGIDLSSFPSNGVEVDKEFLKQGIAASSTVRFLLQCRKLSQIMSRTWIDPKNIEEDSEKTRTQIIKNIFDLYNVLPETYWLKNIKELGSKSSNYELEKMGDVQIRKKILEIKENNEDSSAFIIPPTHMGYRAISLALLLCGQVYYQDKNNNWTRLCNPIFSTYEAIWEYALDISWDTFYAYRTDLSQTGLQPNPPFTQVTLGYPPRPDEFSLRQEDLKAWVNAEVDYSEDNPYPFYPKENSAEWNSQELKFVQPPYPYLPLSTC